MRRAAFYLLLSVFFTWPTAIAPLRAVPGSGRGDLWEGLWSFWFFARKLAAGEAPLRVDGLLDHPDGGQLWVADPLNALLGLPLVLLAGPALAWSVLVLAHLLFAALAADRLAEACGGRGWVAGPLYAFAPMGLAHIHNGATEAVGTGWLALSGLLLLRGRPLAAGLALALTTIGSWYYGVCGFVLLAVLVVARREARLLLAGLLALGLAAPVAWAASRISTAPDNVVGIKSARELRIVRRSIGAADPVAYLHPGDYRSPDFRKIARYGEDYVHSPYLGWVALLAAAAGLRRPGGRAWAVAAGLGLVLAMGPVLAREGGPVILPGRRGIPLPYLLVDSLPGFSGLSLLWRLAQLGVLGIAILAARGAGRWGALIVLGAILETRLLSPAAGLPGHADARANPALEALRALPEGAVLNWPVVGGRPYLYEQSVHQHPLAGGLNFPSNAAAQRAWRDLSRAESLGIRYVVAHDDRQAGPDPTDVAMRQLEARARPVAEAGGIRVYQLW